MEHLRARYHPVSLDVLVESARSGQPLAGGVAVTFDDGYRDNIEAAGICADLGIPATFFVATQCFRRPQEYWWDAIERILLTDQRLPQILDDTILGMDLRVDLCSRGARPRLHDMLARKLIQANKVDRDEAIRILAEWSGHNLSPRRNYRTLSINEVRELNMIPGCSIGAHSVHHVALPLLDEDHARLEVTGSKAALEEAIGGTVPSFSYPYGHYDSDTQDIVRSAGFSYAVSARQGVVESHTDFFGIPRCEINPGIDDFPAAMRRFLDD